MAVRPVVVDTRLRSAVAGLRGLGRAGAEPVAVGQRWTDAGLWSRFATRRALAPDPCDDPRGFALAVSRFAPSGGSVVPYPAAERTIDGILEAARHPGRVCAPFPAGPVQLLRRKGELAAWAAERGLRIAAPATEVSARDLRKRGLSFPYAVKAALPHGGIHGTRILESDEDLSRLLSGLEPRERVLVQPRLRNPLTSIGLVMTRTGDIAARFQHVAKWTWPSRAGSTARAASVAPDEGLVSRVGALLAEIGYWGLAEVELLESPLGPALIDVNPRFYGCMALPLACGVNLPAAWHAVAAGMPPPRPGDYRVGVAYRWLEADIVAALRGDAGRMLHAAPRPRTGAMWAGDDPVPGPLLARTAFSARAARRLRQRLR